MKTPQGGGVHGEAALGGLESPLSPPLSPASAAAAALANSRWNPTKEQVAVLEGLYEHGLRTPSAEQIQHITGRLRKHGPVEGKNVFYWFQNHKARQRQKQKQDAFAYFTRLLRRPPPLPVIARPPGPPYPLGRMPASSPPVMTMAPPPHAASNSNGGGGANVMYRAPYYMPEPPPQASSVANAVGYYNLQQQSAHHMAVMYPNPRMEIAHDKQQINLASMYQQQKARYSTSNPLHVVVPPANGGADGGASADHHAGRSRETLELFPLRPTFQLPDNKARGAAASLASPSTPSASASFSGGESENLESPNSNAEALPFYDFFGLQSVGR